MLDITNAMENSIKAIDAHSVHKITSGQVIVDLQTAVKELVENSIDAGATNIEVRFKDYGLKSIEVIDNGCGIAPKDYDGIALKHHTSKLATFEDLSTVVTFGFRGEALSSLCVLCDGFTVTTATAEDAPMATVLQMDRLGKVKDRTGRVARQRGTTVVVTDLFKFLPVRRKELERNIKREFGKALNLLNAYALVPCAQENKGIRLTVSNLGEGGRRNVHLKTEGSTSTRASVQALWGVKALDNLVDLDISFVMEMDKTVLRRQGISDDDLLSSIPIQVRGLISKFAVASGRASTDRQYFFINGRPFQPSKIQKAFNEVYRTFNANQSPFIAANFIVPTNICDINVSPDKRTIFIHSEDKLLQSLKTALEDAFSSSRSTLDIFGSHPISQSQPMRAALMKKMTSKTDSRETVSSDTVSEAIDEGNEDKDAITEDLQATTDADDGEGSQEFQEQVTQSRDDTLQNTLSAFAEASTRSDPAPTITQPPSKSPLFIPESDDTDLGPQVNLLDDMAPYDVLTDIRPSSPRHVDTSDVVMETGEHGQQSSVSADTRDESTVGSDMSKFIYTEARVRRLNDAGPKNIVTSPIQMTLSTKRASWNRNPAGEMNSDLEDPPKDTTGRTRKKARLDSTGRSASGSGQSGGTYQTKITSFNAQQSLRSRLKSFASAGSQLAQEKSDDELDQLEDDDDVRLQNDSHDGECMAGTLDTPRGPSSSGLGQISTVEDDVLVDLPQSKPQRGQVSSRLDEEKDKRSSIPDIASSSSSPDVVIDLTDGLDDSKLEGLSHGPETLVGSAESCKSASRPEIIRTVDKANEAVTLKLDMSHLEESWRRICGRLSQAAVPSSTAQPAPSPSLHTDAGLANTDDNEKAAAALSRIIDKEDFLRSMEIIGQFNLGFIVARRRKQVASLTGTQGQTDNLDDLIIIDQHAADEKYNFETLQQTTTIHSQKLYTPQPLELTAADELIAIDNIEVLRQNGFEVDVDESASCGQGARLQLVAQPMSKRTVFDMKDLEELIHLMRDRPTGTMVRCSKARAMFASRACRKSVMVGMPLKESQMQSVVQHMGTMEQPWNCPHGRPTMRHLADLTAVEKGDIQSRKPVDWKTFRPS